jgi:chromosome segregation ATPase
MMMMQVASQAQAALDLLTLIRSTPETVDRLLMEISAKAQEVAAAQAQLATDQAALTTAKAAHDTAVQTLATDRLAFESDRTAAMTALRESDRLLTAAKEKFEGERADALSKISAANGNLRTRETAVADREADSMAVRHDLTARAAALIEKETAVEALRVQYETALANLRALIPAK